MIYDVLSIVYQFQSKTVLSLVLYAPAAVASSCIIPTLLINLTGIICDT